MAAIDNVVELVIRVVDEATAPIRNLVNGLDRLSKTVLGISLNELTGWGGLAAGIRLFVKESAGAQDATVRLDRLYSAFSNTIGVTRQELKNFAEAAANTSRFSSTEITQAQATLIRFGTLTGDTLKQAEQAAVDFGSHLGDVSQAAYILSRALAAPEQSTRMLMMAGIRLTPVQQENIKKFMELGQVVKADAIILDEFKKRYGGAAAEDLNTFSGAVKHLTNNFAELFNQQGPLHSFTTGIRELGDALGWLSGGTKMKDQEDLKKQIELLNKIIELRQKRGAPTAEYEKQRAELRKGLDWTGGAAGASEHMEEITITGDPKKAEQAYKDQIAAAKKAAEEQKQLVEDYKKLLDSMNEDTQTSLEKDIQAWHKFENELNLLVAEGQITPEEARKRAKARTDEVLAEFQPTVQMIKATKAPLDEISKQQIQAVKNIQNAFANAFMSIGSGIKGMLNAFLNAIKQMVAEALAANLVEALFGSISPTTGTMSGGTSWGAALMGGLTGALTLGFGGLASGGTTGGGPVWVGERGPELLVPPAGSQVFNQQQLAGMGGMHYAPVTNIVIQPKDGDVNTLRQELYSAIAINNKRQKDDIYYTLNRNGFGRMR